MYYTLCRNMLTYHQNLESNDAMSTFLLEEKKSKFYGYLFSIQTQEDANQRIAEIRACHKDARHIVYLYSYELKKQLCYRFSDDGEPKGTGTKAIYELLEKEQITNVCIVIVRYFGGVLLGAGPLSRAYLNTARGAIEGCEKVRLFHFLAYQIQYAYPIYQAKQKRIEQAVEEGVLMIDSCEFTTQVSLHLQIREDIYTSMVDFLQ